MSGCILAKSKFYGNSLSAVMDGSARLVFLNRGEEYVVTMPYAHCKGETAVAVQSTELIQPVYIINTGWHIKRWTISFHCLQCAHTC